MLLCHSWCLQARPPLRRCPLLHPEIFWDVCVLFSPLHSSPLIPSLLLSSPPLSSHLFSSLLLPSPLLPSPLLLSLLPSLLFSSPLFSSPLLSSPLLSSSLLSCRLRARTRHAIQLWLVLTINSLCVCACLRVNTVCVL